MLPTLFSLYLKMLVLYSPFFVLSCFISLTRGYTVKERKRLAWKVASGTLIASVLLYLFGQASSTCSASPSMPSASAPAPCCLSRP